MQLRYFDEKRMGQVYYLPPEKSDEVVRLDGLGPDVLDEPMDLAGFKAALKPFRGEVKGVLTRGHAVSGIGNAYADEVLFAARVFPFKKLSRLSPGEVQRLHEATYHVPREAVPVLRQRVGADIHKKVRDFLKVHGRGGEPCPVCGNPITAITANRRETNYCRRCQPGSLFD
jgi:formamidopyrimidine-DNA glycosylase